MGGMLKLITLPIRLPFEIWFAIVDTIEFRAEKAWSDAAMSIEEIERRGGGWV